LEVGEVVDVRIEFKVNKQLDRAIKLKVNDLWEVVDVRIELKVNELVRIIRQGKCRKRHSVVCLKDTVVV